jgi:putative flippase GtrA
MRVTGAHDFKISNWGKSSLSMLKAIRSLLGFLKRLATLVRFGVVGIAATITYFVVTALVGRGLDPMLANVFGVAISLFVSYLGHFYFTFRIRGKHAVHLSRFLVVTFGLFILSTVVTGVACNVAGLDRVVVTACIAVCYPIASYVLNLGWTFLQFDGLKPSE